MHLRPNVPVIFGAQAPGSGLRRRGADRRGCRGEARSAISLPPFIAKVRAGQQQGSRRHR